MKIKGLNLVFGVFILVMLAGLASAMTIGSCTVLDKIGEVYTLENDVSSAGTCFNAGADAVTLNCNGHKVTYSNSVAGNGILINNFDRVIVQNCVFVQGSSSSNSDAVRLQDSEESVILSNTMNTVGEYSLGIWLEKAYEVSAAKNKITTSGRNSNGIAVYLASSRNILIENEINAENGIGISIFDGADNQVTRNTVLGSLVDVYIRDGTAGAYNLENSTLIVEDPSYGIINFKKPVSASGDDMTQDVGVMFNLANIDEEGSFSDAFSEITLYRTDSLGLVKKEAWRNNALCPDSICKVISDKDSFKLNATTYGRYSVGFNNYTGGNDDGDDDGDDDGGNNTEETKFCTGVPVAVPGSYRPGYSKSSSKLISPSRMNLSKVEKIENEDTYNFLTLGFGGEIIINYSIDNRRGNDLKVVETSFGNRQCSGYPERVSVDASKDMVNWVHLGEGCLDSEFDLGALDWAQYFKFKDVSNPSRFGSGGDVDGYDIDGIACQFTGNNTDFVIAPPIVVPLNDYYVAFEIIGASLTRGVWYSMPETVKIRIGNETFEPWGSYQTPVNSSVNDGNNPRFFYGADRYSAGTPVSLDVKAWKKRKLYHDGRNNEHWMVFSECSLTEDVGRVRILKNGDAVPITKGGAFDQSSVKEYLARFVSSDGKIILGGNQAIFLFEMGEANYNSQVADWQDLVVLATLSDSAITPPASASRGGSLIGYLVKNLGESNATSIGALLILAVIVYILIVVFKKILSK